MNYDPIFETKPPFVIKVYKTFFTISWESLPIKEEDNYFYQKIKSVTLVIGKETVKRNILHFLLTMLTDRYQMGLSTREDDELLIEFKTGKKESRYFNKSLTDQHKEAIELIKTKLKTNA